MDEQFWNEDENINPRENEMLGAISLRKKLG
jgi:hypothetical protein